MAGQAGRLKRLALVVAALGCCAATGPSSPVQVLAGRYYAQFPDGFMDGTTYTGQNVVEIVPVADDAAYVRVHLDYFNGHICGIYGVAKAEGSALVYHDPSTPLQGKPACTLSITRTANGLHLDDSPANSCSGYCGARGTLHDVALPWKSKRPIRYMAKLKASSEYRDALTEWRTGKPVNP